MIKRSPTEKPDVLNQFKHGTLDLYNGTIQLHYVEAGDPQKPFVLALPGFPEFWYAWHNQLTEFQNDYRIVALDLRGYGESSKPSAVSEYTMDKLVEDVRQVIEILGNGKCFLLGHDWGGTVAWNVAIQHPDLIEKLIIFNSPHPKPFQDALTGFGNLKQKLRSEYMFFFMLPRVPEITIKAHDFALLIAGLTKPPFGCRNPKAMTEQDIAAWKYNFAQPGALTGGLNYYRANVPDIIHPKKPADGKTQSFLVKPPTLIVWGTKDAYLENELASQSLKYCQNGKLHAIEGASHWVQFDRPDLVNPVVREFLSN